MANINEPFIFPNTGANIFVKRLLYKEIGAELSDTGILIR